MQSFSPRCGADGISSRCVFQPQLDEAWRCPNEFGRFGEASFIANLVEAFVDLVRGEPHLVGKLRKNRLEIRVGAVLDSRTMETEQPIVDPAGITRRRSLAVRDY